MQKIGVIDRTSGIYKIVCLTTGKIYVGSAQDILARFYAHQNKLRRGVHHSVYLQRAWLKYGEDQFAIEVVERCPIADLLIREQYYFDMWKPHNGNGFNMCPTPHGKRGYKMTEEQKIKIGNSCRGKRHTAEYIQRAKADTSNKEMLKSWSDKMKITFDIVSPEGILYTVTGISAFCREHGITPQNVSAMRHGKQKSVQGWRLPYTIANQSTNV